MAVQMADFDRDYVSKRMEIHSGHLIVGLGLKRSILKR